MSRENRSRQRRQALYEGRLQAAETPKKRLWIVCGWLVSEAWRAGRLTEAETAVRETITNLCTEEVQP